jgi:hypothetical protein
MAPDRELLHDFEAAQAYERLNSDRPPLLVDHRQWASRPWRILRAGTGEMAAWRLADGRAEKEPIA